MPVPRRLTQANRNSPSHTASTEVPVPSGGLECADRAYPNTYTSPEEFPLAYNQARDLLVELKTTFETRADEFRAERRKRDLENRN